MAFTPRPPQQPHLDGLHPNCLIPDSPDHAHSPTSFPHHGLHPNNLQPMLHPMTSIQTVFMPCPPRQPPPYNYPQSLQPNGFYSSTLHLPRWPPLQCPATCSSPRGLHPKGLHPMPALTCSARLSHDASSRTSSTQAPRWCRGTGATEQGGQGVKREAEEDKGTEGHSGAVQHALAAR